MMQRPRFPNGWVALAIALGASSGALAMTEGKTTQDERFVSGGVAVGERDALEKRRTDFNLWVVTAAKRSGAFLVDAEVKVIDMSGETVVDTKLDGPWLLVDLKPGEYTVEARYAGQSLRKSTTVHAGARRKMNLYFDVGADVLPPG